MGALNGKQHFSCSMERYSKMPRVQEWEELMHKYQKKISNDEMGDVWWQPMKEVYHQD